MQDLKKQLIHLCLAEGWEVKNDIILVNDLTLPLSHPYQVYLKLYKDAKSPTEKFNNMMSAHNILWPDAILTNNYWQDRILQAHCNHYEGESHIILAGGSGIGKSLTTAKVALLWWLANPKQRSVVISSTTLDSLETRIWGYVVQLLEDTKLKNLLPAKVLGGKPPKVMYPGVKSKMYGMFAAAVREGEAERTLATFIGRHPKDGLMLVLDECTDIAANMVKTFPNLAQGTPFFQLFGIGNSNDKNDLHGSLATPKDGWDSVHPDTHNSWPTNHENGICLYFNPDDSPAIHETDPLKKAALSKFLITEEKLAAKKLQYGTESNSYFRFVKGFWRSESLEKILMSKEFLTESGVQKKAHWSGLYPLAIAAGLDPAIQSGKKGCVLKFALVGHLVTGQMVIDFMQEDLTFYIDINVKSGQSSELQLADAVVGLLRQYNCPLRCLALDATGMGRALGELIKIRMGSQEEPIRVVSTRGMNQKIKDDTLLTIPPIELWANFRSYAQHQQIRGLDDLTMSQFCNRKVIKKANQMSLESKKDYTDRMSAVNPQLAMSPNEADSAVLAVLAVMHRIGLSYGELRPIDNKVVRMQEKYNAFVNNKKAMDEKTAVRGRESLTATFTTGLEDLIWKVEN
jgi:hypothetical protein